MQNATWTKEIVVRNGKRATYRYREDLYGMGFRYEPHRGNGTWTLRADCDKYEEKLLKRFCRRKKLQITITNRNLVRSSDYRKNFFEVQDQRVHRCAYCGKKLSRKNITVDHIVPVSRFKGNRAKGWLKILRIEDINEYRNLAPACQRCNQKKGSKGGYWILKGFIGKNYYVRTVINWIRNLTLIGVAAIAAYAIIHTIMR